MPRPAFLFLLLLLLSAPTAFAQAPKPPKQAPPTRLQLLQGTWQGGGDGGMRIKGNRLTSFLHPSPPLPLRLVGDTLLLYFNADLVTRNRVLKLDQDSLVIRYTDGTMRRYYRSR